MDTNNNNNNIHKEKQENEDNSKSMTYDRVNDFKSLSISYEKLCKNFEEIIECLRNQLETQNQISRFLGLVAAKIISQDGAKERYSECFNSSQDKAGLSRGEDLKKIALDSNDGKQKEINEVSSPINYNTIKFYLDAQRESFIQYIDTIGPIIAETRDDIAETKHSVIRIERILKSICAMLLDNRP
jgi:hypothetical protein